MAPPTPNTGGFFLSRAFCPSFLTQAAQALSSTTGLIPGIKLDDVCSVLETGSSLQMLRDCYYFQYPLKEGQVDIRLCISGI